MRADEKLTAFMELERAIYEFAVSLMCKTSPVSDHIAAESPEKPQATRVDEVEIKR